MTKDISLVIPCYNEETILLESIRKLIAILKNSRFSYEVIFVDDGSRDRTREMIAALVRKNRNFRALYHERNQGRGKTVRDGVMLARAPVVGFIDIDLEVSPVYVPLFVHMIRSGDADIVTGLRMYREALSSLHREILSRGYSWLVRTVLGIPLRDTETGYKFFHREKILPIVKQTRHNGWFWDTEIMTLAFRAGLRIHEEPVLFTRRFDKKSSVRLVADTLDYAQSLIAFRMRLWKHCEN